MQKISEILKKAFIRKSANPEDYVTVSEIMHTLHESGFGILFIIFAAPSLIPAFQPPIPTFFAVPLVLFAFQMVLKLDHPWLPGIIGRRRVKRGRLQKLVSKSLPMFQKLELLIRPRLSWMHGERAERVIGVFVMIFAATVAIPIPFTNLVPSIAIIIIGFGLISKDGVLTLSGLLLGIAWVIALYFGAQYIAEFLGVSPEVMPEGLPNEELF